jgi:Na+:H+ antiporter, NhaA family
VTWLVAAAGALALAPLLRLAGAARPPSYIPVGVAAWYATYRAGVHPTIAGVALGLLTPAVAVKGRTVLEDLEHLLHPWSSYLVVPLFALANAGVKLDTGLADALTSRLTIAVAVGLVVGKALGISVATFGALATKATRLPAGVDRVHVVGFTVALFIASLAFTDEALEANAKIGILLGSLVSGIIGAAILGTRRPQGAPEGTSPPR